MRRGYLEEILTDNGPEFTCKVTDAWAYIKGITHRFIEPGKPSQNGYIESFKGNLYYECLNEHHIVNLEDAGNIVGEYQRIDNKECPVRFLDKAIQSEFSEQREKRRSLCLNDNMNNIIGDDIQSLRCSSFHIMI